VVYLISDSDSFTTLGSTVWMNIFLINDRGTETEGRYDRDIHLHTKYMIYRVSQSNNNIPLCDNNTTRVKERSLIYTN